ncbi:MAG: hypothetical protein HUK22_06105 [Thermoguttaceae bacterium]|nr:hypothetical protein [Thermoguttaceae bacterium]
MLSRLPIINMEGEEISVMILRVDCEERKIGLSRKRVGMTEEAAEEVEEEEEAPAPSAGPTIKPEQLKGGMDGASGPLFKLPGQE